MMLTLTTEQQEIADATERFLATELPLSRVRELATATTEPSLDDATWSACADAGWLSLGLNEATDGLGLGAVEEIQLFRRIGQHLAPGPFRSTVIAAHLAAAADDGALAKRLASGELRCGTVVDETGLDAEPGQMALRVSGDVLQLVEGYDCVAIEGVDCGVRTSVVTGGSIRIESRDPRLFARARLLAAAEALGVIEAVRDMSAQYAADRIQFGVPIGSFQAVKHRCADMAIAAYAATSQVAFAAHRLDDGCGDAPFHAAAAYLVAVSGARRSVADNIQNHGAIGFTLEHDAHLYLRRAHTLERALGSLRLTQRAVLEPERHEFC